MPIFAPIAGQVNVDDGSLSIDGRPSSSSGARARAHGDAGARGGLEKGAMTRKRRRLVLIGSSMSVLALAVVLMLLAFGKSIRFFSSPTELAQEHLGPGVRVRLGGLVKPGSVVRDREDVRFAVTDGSHDVPVLYRGIPPDLFREGQGVVTEGALDSSGTFEADTVLAKHDERYMPKDVAESLKKRGLWEEDGTRNASAAPPAQAR